MCNIGDIRIIAKEVRKKYPKKIATCILAVMGIPSEFFQIGNLLGKSAMSIPDWLFYNKLNIFLKGVELSDNDRAKMRAFLSKNGCEADNCIRIMNCINMAESEKKIEFISNATRCALNYEMDLSLYFRVVNVINMLVEDDIEFLAENITLFERPEDNHLKQNNHTQALFAVGAMRMITTVWKGGDYAFTSFGKVLDASTISFTNDAKYPNRKEVIASYFQDELQ